MCTRLLVFGALLLVSHVALAPAVAAPGEDGKDVKVGAVDAGPSGSGTYWALLVGIDQYENPDIARLDFAAADVKAVAQALVRDAGYPEDHVKLMVGDAPDSADRPTNVNVIKRLDTLSRKIGPEDTFVFYFSGHGYQKEEGRHFLATINADPASIETLEVSTIPLELLQKKMRKIQARRVIFFVDACRNDPENGRGAVDNALSGSFARNLQVVAASAASGMGGSAVFYACSEGERAYEWREKGHGVFSYYLLEALAGKAADAGGELCMTTVGDYVQRQVLAWDEEHNRRQKPDLHQQGAARIVLGRSAGGPIGGEVQEIVTTATIEASSDPTGAVVLVDGEEQAGRTPCKITVNLGTDRTRQVEVGVKQEGYQGRVLLVDLVRGKVTPVHVTLGRVAQVTPPPRPGGQGGARPDAHSPGVTSARPFRVRHLEGGKRAATRYELCMVVVETCRLNDPQLFPSGTTLDPDGARQPEPFVDVPKGHDACNAVECLRRHGLLVGFPDGTLKGLRPFARYEWGLLMARLLSGLKRIASSPASPFVFAGPSAPDPGVTPFKDVPFDHWATDGIGYCRTAGVLTGESFRGNQMTLRGELEADLGRLVALFRAR